MITLDEFIQSRHGHRPFDVAFVEHIKLDVELVCSWAKVNLGNAWVTFLIDSYSRRILATYLTFDPPNYRSCMMVMRVCVRRYERLPTTIVVHKGKEFFNVHFERFLETYYCRKQTILEAEPRFGFVCERLFGSANAMLIRNIQGNTQINSNAEGTTKSIKSQSLAVWTLKGLYQNLCRWAYEFYDKKEHPDLGLSPYEAFKKGLLRRGLHSHNKRIVFDEEFRISTLPTTSKGIATVRPGFGVKINNIYYWHNNFQHPDVEGNQVAVRYDPYDIGTAYAYINKHWVSCISQYYASFAGHSEKEIMLVVEELRKLHKNSSKRFVVTASSLFNYLNQEEIHEQVILQRVRDMEARFLLSEIDFGHVQEYRQGTEEEFVFYANIERVMPQQGDESEEIKPYDEFW